ncbi:Protein CBG04310 [Caenorhabditis briggsae]|uniref:Protein CBG04310 n=1 Tax=Caenorhabditis briggsae TaxID=6238 RepID=A8WX76_CAEBR|nr:Protein CBG04310 [Caenorhabditis briggsae]CAP25043.2 Protein CBG04310 [Caenorhabditis briggsae]
METKQSMDCILNDPSAKSKPVVPKLITVNPLNIIIEPKSGQIDKTLELNIGEKTMIRISMIDGSKYQSNHQFIVQSMPAPGDFADRKLIWKQPNYLGILTTTRVKTMRPGLSLSKNGGQATSPALSTSNEGGGARSPALMDSNESLVTPSVPSWTKPVSSIDHGKFADNINDLTTQVKKAIAEKNTRASEMVSVVNQIKSIEV